MMDPSVEKHAFYHIFTIWFIPTLCTHGSEQKCPVRVILQIQTRLSYDPLRIDAVCQNPQ